MPSNTRLEGARAHLLPPVLTGELFAQAPVDQFPGTAVESVTDSSRYFVVRIEDGNGMLGLGALLSFRSLASRNRRLMALTSPLQGDMLLLGLALGTEGTPLTSTWHYKTISSEYLLGQYSWDSLLLLLPSFFLVTEFSDCFVS